MKHARTYIATIYVSREVKDGPVLDYETIVATCRAYCDQVGLCVTVSPVTFVYTDGQEEGAAVGLINYPRFPSSRRTLRRHALNLTERLQVALGQRRASVVLPGLTYMTTYGDRKAGRHRRAE